MILSAVATYELMLEKLEWIKENMPFIKEENVYFIALGMSKIEYMKEIISRYEKKYDIDIFRENVIILDDTHSILFEAEKEGFTAYHVTSFLVDLE